MKNAAQYYENSININKISNPLSLFFKLKFDEQLKGRKALDIGCGAGNDTIYLLNKDFKVAAIDSEPQVKDIILSRINDNKNLELIIDDFSKTQLPNADLILANLSLFFVKKDFNSLIERVLKNVNEQGFFAGNFLGNEDDWKGKMATLEKDELLSYFSNFKIMYYSEEKYYKDSFSDKNKFWHIYTIIAKKK